MNALILHERRGPLQRAIHSLRASTLEEVVVGVTTTLPGARFVLFLAWDARDVEDETIFALAQRLVRAGLSYIVAWGPDCERVHDLFDDADIVENPESNTPGTDTVIMSTWHPNESLEEALWFALYSAYPAISYESKTISTVAAVVANDTWAKAVEEYLDDLSSLNRVVGL
jgi:hypothetical protein